MERKILRLLNEVRNWQNPNATRNGQNPNATPNGQNPNANPDEQNPNATPNGQNPNATSDGQDPNATPNGQDPNATPDEQTEGAERTSTNSNEGNGDQNSQDPTTNVASVPVSSQAARSPLYFGSEISQVYYRDEVPIDPDKPKRPFLKKGVGLARYNMKREDYVIYNNRCVRKSKKATPTPYSDAKPLLDKPDDDQNKSSPIPSQSKTPPQDHGLYLWEPPQSDETPQKDRSTEAKPKQEALKVLRLSPRQNNNAAPDMQVMFQENDLEPLSLPDGSVNFSGRWLGRFGERQSLSIGGNNEDVMVENVPTQSSWRDEFSINNANEDNQGMNASANELRVFETLERRVNMSGFCSTNSSIVQLLDNPQRVVAMPGYLMRNWRDDLPAHLRPFMEQLARTMDDVPDGEVVEEDNSSSLNTDSTDQEYSTSDLSDYGSRDGQSLSSDMEDSPSSQGELLNVPDYCDRCFAPIRAKLNEYAREISALTASRNNFEAVKAKMESEMLEFEEEAKIKRREIDDMKAALAVKLQNAEQAPTRENKALQQELAKVKQEVARLKIELKESQDLAKVCQSSSGVRMAKMRNMIRDLEKQNAKFRSEVAALTADKNRMATREQNATKSAEMNILRRVANDVTDLKKTTMNLQAEANASKGAIKKIPVVANTPEKRKVRKRENRCNVRDLTEVEIHNEDTDVDRQYQQHKRVAQKRKGRSLQYSEDSSEENVALVAAYENQCSNGLNKKQVDNTNTNDTLKKTMFFRRAHDLDVAEGGSVCTDPEDDEVMNDILQEILTIEKNSQKTADNQHEEMYEDGTREIRYSNGNIKIITPDCVVRYYYALKDLWQTLTRDGLEILEKSSGQRDERGTNKIFHVEFNNEFGHPNIKNFDYTVVQYSDGSFLKRNDVTGDCTMYLPNGEKEIHGPNYKSRVYKDGSSKTVFVSGIQETRYPNGRIRVKAKTGELLLDTFEEKR